MFNFKGKEYDYGNHHHQGKVYGYANPKNKDTIKLIKNLEKEFQKVTKLKNSLNLKLNLYDPEQQKEGLNMLNQSKLKVHGQTDQDLVGSLM